MYRFILLFNVEQHKPVPLRVALVQCVTEGGEVSLVC